MIWLLIAQDDDLAVDISLSKASRFLPRMTMSSAKKRLTTLMLARGIPKPVVLRSSPRMSIKMEIVEGTDCSLGVNLIFI